MDFLKNVKVMVWNRVGTKNCYDKEQEALGTHANFLTSKKHEAELIEVTLNGDFDLDKTCYANIPNIEGEICSSDVEVDVDIELEYYTKEGYTIYKNLPAERRDY